jgi:MFS family permease
VKLPLVLEPLRHRDFRLLWTGQTVSTFGNFLHQVAVPFQLLALGAGPLQLGLGVSIGSAVSLLVILFAGAIVDRVPRRSVILACDLGSGFVVLAIALLSLTGNLRIEHIYIESALFGLSGAFFFPAMGAIVPELIPPEILVQGNTLRSFSRQAARLSGPVVGGILVATAGPGWAFLGDALTFFVSFGALLLATPRRGVAGLRQPILREIRAGLAFTFALPWLWITIVVFAFANFAYAGPLIVAMPLLVRDVLRGDASVFGFINASNGVGEIIGGVLIGQLRIHRVGIVMYGAAAFGAFWLAMYGLVPAYPLLLLYGVGLGMGFVGFGVLWDSAVQRHVPGEMLGRVGSVDWFGSIFLGPFAPLAAAALIAPLGPAAVLALGGLVCAGLCLVTLAVPSIRALRA